MDEASRLITELQQKLAQLDHKIWLYRQDMASEFKKYADELLRNVPDEVSDTVSKAIAESLKSYPLLDVGPQEIDPLREAVETDYMENSTVDSTKSAPDALHIPAMPPPDPESPSEAPRNIHEREQEFQGLFTPSYLPLLDSTDRNERKSSSISLSPASESKAISILERERATEDTSPISSSYPSTSLPLPKPPTPPRRRNTDEGSTNSDQSDTPIRRSALRRSSNASKPQSPRHVRFEFAGEEFPTTSSPKLESLALDAAERTPIILGNGEDTDYGTLTLQEEEIADSPPRKRISSSEALRLLSRGPVEDDGTQWTEVKSPPDGSASVPKTEADSEDEEDEEDEDSLSMRPLSVRDAASRWNGHKRRNSGQGKSVITDDPLPIKAVSQFAQKTTPTKNGDDADIDIAEQEGALEDLAPLQPMKAHTPVTTISAAELESKYANRSKTVATKSSGKSYFVLADGSDIIDLPESKAKLDINDDDEDNDELFAFDENTDRPQQKPEPEPDSEPDTPTSDTAEETPMIPSQYATSPACPILKPGTPSTTSTPTAAPLTSHRSSYHPFNTPIVSEAIHAQAASLGNVNTFVGSMKNGLDEDALQSFRAGAGSLGGGAPRSLSEKMAFDDAMEAQREAAKKH